jgi:hypothetical protein
VRGHASASPAPAGEAEELAKKVADDKQILSFFLSLFQVKAQFSDQKARPEAGYRTPPKVSTLKIIIINDFALKSG